MITAADGCAEFYDNENVARYENVEEAVLRDRALRSCYIGHNKLFFIGNNHPDGFQGKINEVLSTVMTILGCPTSLTRFKKFLVDTKGINFEGNERDVEKWGETPSYDDYHGKIFKASQIEPYNSEQDARVEGKPNKFNFVTNTIRHTYLKAPEGSLIYVRKRSGLKFNNEPVSSRSNHFEYVRKYLTGSQQIEKKRIMGGREYEDLLLNEFDEKRRQLKILRTSFPFENQYFQLETFTNIRGAPTFLLVESDSDSIRLPPFVKVEREVSGLKQFKTVTMARHDFKVDWQ
jgi:hypothetical protein